MRDRTSTVRTCAVLLVLLLMAPAAALAQGGGQGSSEESLQNVRLTFRMGPIENGVRKPIKSYELIVAAGTPGSTLLSGDRVPIPITEDDADGDGGRRFVYQNIGFSTSAEAWILSDGRIRLIANLEDSRIREDEAGGPPTVETRQLTINAVLEEGKASELTRVERVDGSGYVEVEARIER